MPKIKYIDHRFSKESKEVIDQANDIVAEYAAQGFDLTLRQLYYQFVSRALIPNKDSEYKKLGSVINDARLAGLIDWDHITDRTRFVRQNSHWNSPADIMNSAAKSFAFDKWAKQSYRPEVWIEKDALVGVIEGVCQRLDVPYFSCRGYTSQSEMWSAAQRLARWAKAGQTPFIVHLGDHDPSGIDMTRDIRDRLELFSGGVEVKRVALNMDQVEEHKPPPNPAKITDSRAGSYIEIYGDESWELDALEPAAIAQLIEETVEAVRDEAAWTASVEAEDAARTTLSEAATRWPAVSRFLSGKEGKS